MNRRAANRTKGDRNLRTMVSIATAALYLIVGVCLAFFGWLARVPNPGLGYYEHLDDKGVPQRIIVQFSPLKNFTENLVSNIIWITAFICILAAVFKTMRTLKAQVGAREDTCGAIPAMAVQLRSEGSKQVDGKPPQAIPPPR